MRVPDDDDGYVWSLRFTRRVCAALLLFPLLLGGLSVPILMLDGAPRERPLLVAVLVALGVVIVTAAPFVRTRMARIGIAAHLEGDPARRRPRAVYATFGTAAIAGFFVASFPALFGFLATALTKSFIPLIVGSVPTYAVWAGLWPSRRLWDRWAWEARLRGPRGTRLPDTDTA